MQCFLFKALFLFSFKWGLFKYGKAMTEECDT